MALTDYELNKMYRDSNIIKEKNKFINDVDEFLTMILDCIEEKGLTDDDLISLVEMDKSTINRWRSKIIRENRKKRIDFEKAVKLILISANDYNTAMYMLAKSGNPIKWIKQTSQVTKETHNKVRIILKEVLDNHASLDAYDRVSYAEYLYKKIE